MRIWFADLGLDVQDGYRWIQRSPACAFALKLLEDMREVIRVCEASLDEMRGLTRDLAQAMESQ